MVWQFFYNIAVVPLMWTVLHLLAFFSDKVKKGIQGRRDLFASLERQIGKLRKGSQRVWFHSSSMGEFEQAKPIIAELKKRHPEIDVIVSFFSPSGYEHTTSYKHADVIIYLPFDSRNNAERFVRLVQPAAAIMVRYDIWPNHIWALQRAQVPTFIANATLGKSTARGFPFVKQFHTSLYNALDYILTVSQSDKQMFQSFGLRHPVIEVIGDTRYDQVIERRALSKTKHLLPQIVIEKKKVVVTGSSWDEDEEVVLPAFARLLRNHPDAVMVLVPHEPTLAHLERTEYRLNGTLSSIRFSNLNDYSGEKVIVIDSVGILMGLYRYAAIAYVGGSFRQGVHNVLEPAVYGIPIIVGPQHKNSQEAVQLIEKGATFMGSTVEEVYQHLDHLFTNEEFRREAGTAAAQFVQKHIGATQKFLSYLEQELISD